MSMLPHLRTPHLRPARRLARAAAAPLVPVRDRSATLIDCGVYVDGIRRPGRCEPSVIDEVRRTGDGFVWLGLHDPDETELAELAERYDLHPLAVEDALYAEHQRPKLDRYEDTLFAVLKTVRYVHPESPAADVEVVETGEISVFVGRDFVITVRRGEPRGLQRAAPVDGAGPGAARAGAVGGAARDHGPDRGRLPRRGEQHAAGRGRGGDRGLRRAGPVEAGTPSGSTCSSARCWSCAGRSRRWQAPLRTLSERPVRLVHPEIREYFRDVEDHLARVTEQIGSFDELLTTIIQANLAQVTVEQNEDMRRISAWVAILAIPTAVAGIYGMNFRHMPELTWRYGYPATLVVIASSAWCSTAGSAATAGCRHLLVGTGAPAPLRWGCPGAPLLPGLAGRLRPGSRPRHGALPPAPPAWGRAPYNPPSGCAGDPGRSRLA